MTPIWVKPLAAGLIGGLILGLLLARGRPVDPVTMFRVDSVLIEAPGAARQRDSLSRVAVQSQRQALRLQGEAARLRRVADSLRAATPNPTGVDTSLVPGASTAAYDVSVAQAAAYDTLSQAYGVMDSAFHAQLASTAALRAEVLIAESRIQTLERTLTEARGALAKTRTPSRFGLGCGLGYSVAVSGGVAHAGPGLACGVTLRLR